MRLKKRQRGDNEKKYDQRSMKNELLKLDMEYIVFR